MGRSEREREERESSEQHIILAVVVVRLDAEEGKTRQVARSWEELRGPGKKERLWSGLQDFPLKKPRRLCKLYQEGLRPLLIRLRGIPSYLIGSLQPTLCIAVTSPCGYTCLHCVL
ncbi:hypothetical protein INR49_008747 [Caranx melampygus]|nr:hypothetical protein INR49_008747 [Caranx melampygus]